MVFNWYPAAWAWFSNGPGFHRLDGGLIKRKAFI